MLPNLNHTNLKSIEIYGLFNKFNVNIPFNNDVNIYIGENGLGKTTILNCIYYILSLQLNKLKSISFNEIKISYKDGNYDIIDKENLDNIIKNNLLRHSSFYKTLRDKEMFSSYIKKDKNLPPYYLDKMFYYIMNDLPEPSKKSSKKSPNSKQNKLLIRNEIKEKPLYLPTYRRIENSFNDELTKEVQDEHSINFGMSDVTDSIKKILDEIKISSITQFNTMTSKLLKQALNKESPTKGAPISQDINTIKIVLNRLSNVISSEDKQSILSIFEKYKFRHNNNYKFLLSFMNQLVMSYNKEQKKYDDKINNFVTTCNRYFNNKYFYYNPNTLELNIYWEDDIKKKSPINLNQLSSGEKQIVAIFSKLYLKNEDNTSYIIIIDEPELSLSLYWQRMLLPDIMDTKKCKLLLTVTHSPFIFNNKYEALAKDIKRYITPIK